MKLTKEQEAEVIPIYNEWWHSYLNGDVKTYDHYLDDDYRFVGSTVAEDFLNKRDTTQFFDATADQLAGKTQKRNSKLTTEYYDGVVFITELADAYLLFGDEWTFYGKFRFSSMLRKRNDGWRFIYQHFSVPDSKAQEGETIGFEQVSKENQELRDAIKRRTAELENKNRDLKIEAALERVRARSSAMQYTDELGEVIALIFNILDEFDISVKDGVALITFNEGSKDLNEWMANPGFGTAMNFHLPYFDHPVLSNLWDAKNRGEDFLIERYSEEESRSFLNHIFEHSDFKHTPQPVKEYCLAAGTYATSIALQKHTAIFINDYSGISLTSTEVDLLKRFSTVFEQTYTRFLDIQKAEAQARESQIQLALERVRARTMAMQHSDELMETSELMFEQIKNLGIELWSCGFSLWYDDDSYFLGYNPGPHGKLGNPLKIPLTEDIFFTTIREAKRRGDEFLVFESEGESLVETYRYMDGLPVVGETMRGFVEAGFPLPTFQVTHCGFFSNGHLMFITQEPNSEAVDIFKRFTKVFNQTYTRFLDLQKAEAQVREAQIEASLERVRSRSLAMHKTDELQEVVRVVAEELKNTGVILDAWGAVICTYFEDSKDVLHWTASEDPANPSVAFLLPYFEDELYDEAWASKNRGDSYFAKVFSFDVKNAFFKHAFEHSDYRQLPDEYKKLILESENHGIAWAWSKNSAIMIPSIQGDLPSEDEKEILIRFAKVFEQSFIRFLDLQKAETQAREAKIETALEKIRSRTMAMQKGEELQEVAVLLYKELIALGVTNFVTCGYVEVNEDMQRQHTWVTAPGGDTMGLFHLPLTGDDTFDARYAAWKKKQPVFHQSVAGQVRSDHLEYAITTFNSKEAEEMVRSQFPDPTVFYCFNFSHGYLHLVGGSLLENEEENLLARFTKVFEQTYTRFLDLQKAEAQAREAKIETALEKVRSRTMGMQRSDELAEVANVLFAEMNDLVHNLWTCGFVLCERGREEDEWWLSLEDGFSRGFFLPNVNDYAHATLYEGWLKGDAFRTVQLDGDKLQAHYDWLMQIPVAKNIFDEMEAAGMERPEWQKLHAAYFSKGYLVIITREPCPEEEIFRRFATVFDQTYTRFLDLKKAEAQARESQIEAALEKVRSRSLAMQSPDELIEVAQLLREEMGALGVEELETSSIYIHDEISGNTQCWFTIKDSESGKSVTDQMTIDLQDTWVGREMINFYRSDTKDTSILMQGEQRLEWIGYCGEKSKAFTPEGFYGESIPERTYHLHKFSNGYIGAASPGDISNESWDLLKRATSVFSFAYTRFCDLQKAETRARESRIELALERIRAQVASMQESSDLFDIVVGMRTEFLALGHEADYFWHMRWLPDSYEMSMTSEDGSRIGMVISLPKFVHDEIPALAEWEKGDDPIYVLALDAKGAWSYIESMNTHGDYELADPSAPGKEDIEHIGGLTFIMARTTHGEIGYGLPGMVPEPPKDALDTLVRFAGVFDLAYKRFEDLKAAERQALMIREERDRLEIALKELHATQDQLVQQEKLASLGQLTAGIAHEIKNPLNFVNNFSEVSLELLEEVLEEVKTHGHASHGHASDDHETQQTITEILNDIKSNLTKIHEHGSRADNIVKSMLQHSRGGAGKMEPTDLNALIKEYVNLSFHGMRAGKNPINVDIQLDLDDSMGKVNLIGEDFSRVILNLCNNAFDALKSAKTQRHASLNVRTKKRDNSIAIEIEDNGPGIPDEIKDKILQPFFTTKKGTQGTGLGLSITNDIVKAHGGELSINSTSGSGSTFIITLKP